MRGLVLALRFRALTWLTLNQNLILRASWRASMEAQQDLVEVVHTLKQVVGAKG